MPKRKAKKTIKKRVKKKTNNGAKTLPSQGRMPEKYWNIYKKLESDPTTAGKTPAHRRFLATKATKEIWVNDGSPRD